MIVTRFNGNQETNGLRLSSMKVVEDLLPLA
jgi:hypothetical protein